MLLEHLGHRRGGLQHHCDVHRVRPAAYRSTQPCGAELQRAGEARGEFVGVARGELGGRLRVGIVRDPILWLHKGTRPITSASNEPSRVAEAAPAASTSAWLSGSPPIPAARFVTRDTPSTSAPAARAAMVSCTVDMPTRSAPSTRSIRISAGVS